MNKILTYGLSAAAVVIALVVGVQLLRSPGTDTGAQSTPDATLDPTPEMTRSPSAHTGLPMGSSHELSGEIPVFVTIPGAGWSDSGIGLVKDDALVITGWVGDPFIPEDPCRWASTMPETPATTLDEITDALGGQATRDASEPADVTADGFAGKSITLHVPDEPFTGCDQGKFCTLSTDDGTVCTMWYQEPGMIDDLRIIDRDGEFTFVAGAYYAETPSDTVDEMGAILDSVTFSR